VQGEFIEHVPSVKTTKIEIAVAKNRSH